MLPERHGPRVTCECAVELEANREEGQPGKRAGRLGLGSGKAVKGKDRINQPRRTVKAKTVTVKQLSWSLFLKLIKKKRKEKKSRTRRALGPRPV